MEDLVLKWVQVCVGRGDLIKAMEREGHKWFESADRLLSTLLKCTATFFLLPSHQSGDCLSLISHLSLQPFATCSFLLGDQAETGHSQISVNLHNDVPVHTFSMKQSDVDRHKRRDWHVYFTLLPSFLSDVNKGLCLFSIAEQSIITDPIESNRAPVCPVEDLCL